MHAVLTHEEIAQRAPEPRQTGKVSFDQLFPGFKADEFAAHCIRNGISLAQAKAAMRGEETP